MASDVHKMQKVIEDLQSDLGEGLLACDIWSDTDGVPLVGINPQPKAAALFNEVARKLRKALNDSEYGNMGNFYILDLGPDNYSMTIFAGGHQLGMLLDKEKTRMGILVSVALPKARSGLLEATK